LTGCGITQSAIVQDEVTQNGVMPPSSIPHLQGPALQPKQVRFQGRYGYTGASDGLKPASNQTLGHLTPKHLFYGQVAFPLNSDSSKEKKGVWELGLFGGGAVSLEEARKSNQNQDENLFKNTSLPFLKAGFGVRGPLVQKKRFLLGLNIEGEVSRQAFNIQIDRTQTLTTTFEWNEELSQQFDLGDGETTVTTEQEQINYEEYFFALTPRAALYGQYQVLDFLSLDFGFSAQYIQYQKSTFSNTCTYDKELTDLDQLTDPSTLGSLTSGGECSPEELYPITPYHFDFTYYGGGTFQYDAFHLSMLFAYSHSPFDEIVHASPFTFTTQAGISF
jgi:hypothetical protein